MVARSVVRGANVLPVSQMSDNNIDHRRVTTRQSPQVMPLSCNVQLHLAYLRKLWHLLAIIVCFFVSVCLDFPAESMTYAWPHVVDICTAVYMVCMEANL